MWGANLLNLVLTQDVDKGVIELDPFSHRKEELLPLECTAFSQPEKVITEVIKESHLPEVDSAASVMLLAPAGPGNEQQGQDGTQTAEILT